MIGKKFSASQEMNVIETKIHAKQKPKKFGAPQQARPNRRGPATGAAQQQASRLFVQKIVVAGRVRQVVAL